MKKSLLLSFFLSPHKGGIENYFLNLSRNLPPDKIVWMAEPQPDDDAFDNAQSFKVYRKKYISWLRIFKLTYLSLYRKALSIIKSESMECLLCGHIFPIALTALRVKKKLGIPFVLFTHGREIFEIDKQGFYKSKYFQTILDEAWHIVATTDFMKQHLVKKGADPDKIIIIPPGVDLNKFKPNLDTTSIKSKYNTTNSKVLLTVGRLVERKGHLNIVKALPKLIKAHPDLKYLIAGDGPMKPALEREIDSLGLAEHVTLLGSVSDQDLPYYTMLLIYLS